MTDPSTVDSGDGAQAGTAGLSDALRRRLTDPAWLGRAAGAALCVIALAYAGALGVAVAAADLSTLVRDPLWYRAVGVVPYGVVFLTAATAAGAALGWYRGYWSRAARIHQTLLALLGVVFVWQLATIGLVL